MRTWKIIWVTSAFSARRFLRCRPCNSGPYHCQNNTSNNLTTLCHLLHRLLRKRFQANQHFEVCWASLHGQKTCVYANALTDCQGADHIHKSANRKPGAGHLHVQSLAPTHLCLTRLAREKPEGSWLRHIGALIRHLWETYHASISQRVTTCFSHFQRRLPIILSLN